MPTLEAVDAKIDRARSELRLLKADIAAFCEERARLIVREQRGNEDERWVYRGDRPKAPIQWSVRAGEFAYNLRSALDHLVWQLVLDNGKRPDKRNRFPIQHKYDASNFKSSLRGVSQAVKDYIKSVQPCGIAEREYHSDFGRVGTGLEMLNEICNRDKHRYPMVADACWVGIRSLNERNFVSVCQIGDDVDVVLENGNVLADGIRMFSDHEHLEFIVAPFFNNHDDGPRGTDMVLTVSETLDLCIDSVEIVVSHLRLVSEHPASKQDVEQGFDGLRQDIAAQRQ